MQTLLVLGIIPGTNIQINFQAWLTILALVIVRACLTYFHARDNQDLMLTAAEIQLHASAIHRRLARAMRPTA